MNTLTQQQINQYQWQVADGVARIVNPYKNSGTVSEAYYKLKTDQAFEDVFFSTNAPDGVYSGEAFEIIWQYNYCDSAYIDVTDDCYEQYNHDYDKWAKPTDIGVSCRLFLRLKPSHLPAVLTTQPGDEWKDRYREVWYVQERGNLNWIKVTRRDAYHRHTFEQFAILQYNNEDQATKREWHLITPPAEQEAETVLYNEIQYPSIADALWDWYSRLMVPADSEDAPEDLIEPLIDKNILLEKDFKDAINQLQSTLTQKDQRIAELERDAEHVKRCLSDYTKMCQKKLEEAHVNPLTNFIYKECIDLMRNLKNSINRKNGLNI